MKPGDAILGHDSTSTTVDHCQTGRHETLYNLRVAFDHTYFVGSAAWGFSLWALNFYKAFYKDWSRRSDLTSSTGRLIKVLDESQVAKLLAEAGEGALTEGEARQAVVALNAALPAKSAGREFGKILRSYIGEPDERNVRIPMHHILFKEGLGDAQKALAQEGQEILRSVGIDPIYGRENLVWAPNAVPGQHAIDAIEPLVAALKELKAENAPYEEYVKLLERFGRIAANRR